MFFTISKEVTLPDDLNLNLIDAGAQEFEEDDDILTITCDIVDFGNVNKKLNELGIEPEDAGLKRIPNMTRTLDIESARKLMKFIEVLEDDDDVQNVYHNLEITDELADELEK